ncbi:uncharacterized protein HD556DRAFT_1365957 [Suillus plorans]|uniref:Uncharacterized protein n=1 Tax=Suillus plorans TaxID=116603 RepID=A0A9P7DJ41_9AGAM|nr:uncharacterized protein HD556DRAFT_1365957 [Suillus plorans]KAG1795085.1 hypothetical protein HD556DRAFT_1365957 [Suillus plorans]
MKSIERSPVVQRQNVINPVTTAPAPSHSPQNQSQPPKQSLEKRPPPNLNPNLNNPSPNLNPNLNFRDRETMRDRDGPLRDLTREQGLHIRDPVLLPRDRDPALLPREREPTLLPRDPGLLPRDRDIRDPTLLPRERDGAREREPGLQRDAVLLPRERDTPLLPRERDPRDPLLTRDRDPHFPRERDPLLVREPLIPGREPLARERERDPILQRYRDERERDMDVIRAAAREREHEMERREMGMERREPLGLDRRDPPMDRRDPLMDRRDSAMERRDPVMDRRDPVMDRRDPPMDRRDPAMDRRDPAIDRRDPPMDRRDPPMDRHRPRPPSERGPVPAGPGVLQLHPGPILPHPHTHAPQPERDRESQRERERERERERSHAIAPPLDREREMTIHREREALRERAERELLQQQQQQRDRDRDRERERPGDMQRDKPNVGDRERVGPNPNPGPGSGPSSHRASPLSRPPYVPANTHTHPSPHAHNTHGHTPSHGHVHIPPPHNSHIQQGRGRMLPGQGQFQALPPPHPHPHEWDRDRDNRDREHTQSQRVDRERVDLRLPGPERERHRDRDRDREQRERLPTDQRLSERPGPGEILQLRDPALLVRDRENSSVGVGGGGREQRGEFVRERERAGEREHEQKVLSDRERELRALEQPDRRVGRRTHSHSQAPTQVHSRMPSPMVEERERAMLEREREREHFERERMERERLEREHLEREYMERERERGMNMSIAERERMEREHLERMERQQHLDALERERFDAREREHDLISREHIEARERADRLNLEAIERERAEREAFERLPTPQELALLLQSRMERPHISLGSWVLPALPFPWFFGDHMPCMKQGDAQEIGRDGLVVPPEVRLTVLIPSSFLPASRPHKLRLWGGGLLPPPPIQFWPVHTNLSNTAGNGSGPSGSSATSNPSGSVVRTAPNPAPPTYHPMHAPRRRVYTDDSNVLACAVHAGVLTWSAVSRAKKEGKDIKIVLGVVPTVSSYGGSVAGDANHIDPPVVAGVGPANGTPSNGITPAVSASNGITPSTSQSSASQPTVSSHGSVSNGTRGIAGATALDGMGYAGGVWASRFVGGWGEAFYGHPSAGYCAASVNDATSGDSRQRSFEEEAEDDGRGVVSAGWGWGHDGSAIEVVHVEVVEKGSARGPGLGRRNRSQRLQEYASRRAALALAPATSASPPPCTHLFADVTNGRKRRWFTLDNIDVNEKIKVDPENLEELQKMHARTLVFGDSGTGAGFKYTPILLACALFPHLADPAVRVSLPRKRRKILHAQDPHAGAGDVRMDIDGVGEETGDEGRAVVLESDSETYLVAPGPSPSEGFVLSILLATPTNGKIMDAVEEPANDKNTVTTASAPKITPPASSASENPTTTSDVPKDDQKTPVPVPDPPLPQPISTSPPSEKTVPQSSRTKVVRSNLQDTDFKFEQDCVVVCGQGEDMRVRVVRWRWYL